MWIDNEKEAQKRYAQENPDSLLPSFEQELRDLGFSFAIRSQVKGFLPKHKKTILPIAFRYYQLAKEQKRFNELNYFLGLLGFKGFDDIITQLITDYYSQETPDLSRWCISDCLYRISSRKFVDEYLDIVINKDFGTNRRLIVLILGKLKEERAIPTLINLLEDEEVRLQAINALGDFKREEFRCYFERFQNSKHPGWRKYAKAALKKLNS